MNSDPDPLPPGGSGSETRLQTMKREDKCRGGNKGLIKMFRVLYSRSNYFMPNFDVAFDQENLHWIIFFDINRN